MNEIIVSQSNVYLAGLFLAIFVFGVMTFIAVIASVDYYKKERSLNLIMSVFTIFVLLITIASLRWFLKQGVENHQFRNGSVAVTEYYDLKRDRSLIVASKKSSTPDWLAQQVKVKIIDENDSSYQVQFEDKFAEISKKDVK